MAGHQVGQRVRVALEQGDAGRLGHHGLQAPSRVEMVTGPDHPHRGGVGLAVLVTQVVLDGLDQALVGL